MVACRPASKNSWSIAQPSKCIQPMPQGSKAYWPNGKIAGRAPAPPCSKWMGRVGWAPMTSSCRFRRMRPRNCIAASMTTSNRRSRIAFAGELHSRPKRSNAGVSSIRSFFVTATVLFGSNDFVLMPATPVAKLDALADHSAARPRILRCTMPASLAGLPVVVLPARAGSMQLIGRHGEDARLRRVRSSSRPALGAGVGIEV
ncbi:MAG: Amidase [Acidobacteriaceae bacterium]|nr:Amidase [Acidobacteriaceae bacterium]